MRISVTGALSKRSRGCRTAAISQAKKRIHTVSGRTLQPQERHKGGICDQKAAPPFARPWRFFSSVRDRLKSRQLKLGANLLPTQRFFHHPTAAPGTIFLRLRTGLGPDGSADADGAVNTALRRPYLHPSIGRRAEAESKPSSDCDNAESPLSAMVRGLLGARMLLSNVVGKLLGQSLAALWAFKCSRTYRAPEGRRICLRDSEMGNLAFSHQDTLIAQGSHAQSGEFLNLISLVFFLSIAINRKRERAQRRSGRPFRYGSGIFPTQDRVWRTTATYGVLFGQASLCVPSCIDL
jgi:hypothetical protein